jgi:hypothetical protein
MPGAHPQISTISPTFHRLGELTITNSDFDSAGDGCGPYPPGTVACTYTKDPANCEGAAGPCYDYYALGQYRHKCGQAGWGCNNTWTTRTADWDWYDGAAGSWQGVFTTCSLRWNVLSGSNDTPSCPDQ